MSKFLIKYVPIKSPSNGEIIKFKIMKRFELFLLNLQFNTLPIMLHNLSKHGINRIRTYTFLQKINFKSTVSTNSTKRIFFLLFIGVEPILCYRNKS